MRKPYVATGMAIEIDNAHKLFYLGFFRRVTGYGVNKETILFIKTRKDDYYVI